MNILLIGYGYWGKIWEKTIKNSKHEIHDIIDIHIFKNKIEDVDFDKIDSVIIASPIDTHYKIADLCIKKNKNVLIEKPCTHNLDDIEKLIKLNSSKNIGVGYVLLYCSAIQKIKKSNLKWEKAFFNRSNGSTQKRIDCDVVYDLLCHDISVAYYIFNVIPTVLYCNKNSDSIFCILKFNNTICHFYCSRVDLQKQSNCTFINNDVTYTYNDITKKLQIFQKDNKLTEEFNEYPLNNQLEYFESDFLANLSFAKNIHQFLSLL